jgi:hypothetical protein
MYAMPATASRCRLAQSNRGPIPSRAARGRRARDAERREERREILPMLDESIASGTAVLELLGVAHPDQIGRDAPARAARCGITFRQR